MVDAPFPSVNAAVPPRGFAAALREVRRAGRAGRDGILDLARRRLASLVAFARARSRFYRDLYAGLPEGVADPVLLPPVSKGRLMERFDDWVADPEVTRAGAEGFAADLSRRGTLFLGRYVLFATSGTTGRPSLFLHDASAAAVYAALAAARLAAPLSSMGVAGRLLRNGGRTASVVATGGHYAGAVIESLYRRRHPLLASRSRAFDILSPLPALVRDLNAFRPAILGGYPTALALLAGERAAGRLGIRPALVFTGAERLDPAARERIASAFGCPVRDSYSASEFMGIAYDCARGRLHVNSDWVLLEPVDADGAPVPPGVTSHSVFLTNLANRAAPLIRYDLGDRVTVLPDTCPCGSAFPAVVVEGRRDEVLEFPGPGGTKVSLLPMAVAAVIEETPGVSAYQAVQEGADLLAVRLDESPGADRARVEGDVVRNLRAYLSSQGLPGTAVRVSARRPERDPRGGKLRLVFRSGGISGDG